MVAVHPRPLCSLPNGSISPDYNIQKHGHMEREKDLFVVSQLNVNLLSDQSNQRQLETIQNQKQFFNGCHQLWLLSPRAAHLTLTPRAAIINFAASCTAIVVGPTWASLLPSQLQYSHLYLCRMFFRLPLRNLPINRR